VIVEDAVAPYASVHIRGHVRMSEDLEALRRFKTAIGADERRSSAAEMPFRASCWPGSDRSV
jgi:hypothetical protein